MIYTANSTVTVDGKSYRPGDSVDIQDASAAKELLAVGFIVTLPGEHAPGETLTVDVQQAASQGAQLGHGHGPPVAAADIFSVCVNLPLQ